MRYNKTIVFSFTKILLIAAIVFIPFVARADLIPQPLSLSANPSSPSPGETIAITARTPLFEETTGFFRWQVNGIARPDLSGYGKNEISVTAGALGSTLRITLEVAQNAFGASRASLVIPIHDLALTWAAETYRPKWYAGRALPVRNAPVAVAAIPFLMRANASIPAGELIYTWSIDGKKDVASGIGMDTFRIRMSDRFNTPSRVSVRVTDINQSIQKEATILLRPVEPKLLLYSYLPLGGIEHRTEVSALSFFPRATMDFLLEPFFAPIEDKEELIYSWSVAGTPIPGEPPLPYVITLDATGHKDPFISLEASAAKTERPAFSLSRLFILNLLP